MSVLQQKGAGRERANRRFGRLPIVLLGSLPACFPFGRGRGVGGEHWSTGRVGNLTAWCGLLTACSGFGGRKFHKHSQSGQRSRVNLVVDNDPGLVGFYRKRGIILPPGFASEWPILGLFRPKMRATRAAA